MVTNAIPTTGSLKLFPKECIERGITYAAPFTGKVTWMVNGKVVENTPISFGSIPIMVKVGSHYD